MIKRVNEHLRIHYPLLWNIQLVWIIGGNLTIHLLFFLSGFLSVQVEDIAAFGSVDQVGGEGLHTLSVLCSTLTLIVWLVYYLRNNALKQYYRVSRWYPVKEFLLMLLIVFSSISYFISFEHGVRLKVRTITPYAQYVEELNTINLARGFIPGNQEAYFVLNSCNTERPAYPDYTEVYPRAYSFDTTRPEVKAALRRPDAFSYRNFCDLELEGEKHPRFMREEQMFRRKAAWLDGNRKDSIRYFLQGLVSILNKYKLDYRLNIDSLIELPFLDPYHNVSTTVPNSKEYTTRWGKTLIHETYFLTYPLHSTYHMLEESMPNGGNRIEQWMQICVTMYVALTLSVLIWCYRRFSRKVFLASLVGSLVWAILIGLMASMIRSFDSFAGICIALCLLFLVLAIQLTNSRGGKTPAGVVLNWHSYLAPFFGLFILSVLSAWYNRLKYASPDKKHMEEWMSIHHPVLHWIKNHAELIVAVNLVLAILYFAFLMNRLALRWHVKSEE